MRIGIDLGGTKTEIIALDGGGTEIYRKRVPTNSSSYDAIVSTITGLVLEAEQKLGQSGTVGVGIPGTVSKRTGLVKNANTTVMNGNVLDRDLGRALNRDVRCMNDANCLAVSEAVDGAGKGHRMVFAVILGTGCGSGLAIDGQVWGGSNLVAGEFGHNPLPWMDGGDLPGNKCWCGQMNCLETWISGTAFTEDYARHETGGTVRLNGAEIMALARNHDAGAGAAFDRYAHRLARGLAHVVNLLDPDVIVLGGGMSNVDELYQVVPAILPKYVFGGEADTPIAKNVHGDLSGVRGAAWLW